MQPGFFLGLAENVGDGFAYEILPVKDYSNMPLHRCLATVIRSIVRQRELTDFEAPYITLENLVWTVTNRHGDIIGEEMVDVEKHTEQIEVSEEVQLLEERNPSVLTNTNLFTIPEEEEPQYSPAAAEIDIPPEESDHLEIDVSDDIVIRPQVNNVVVETCEEENHAAISTPDVADNDVPLVTQDSYESDNETNKTITSDNYNSGNADLLNAAFDPDVEEPEVTSILSHQFNGGKLEFLCKYSDGNTEWHLIDLLKNDDPYFVANYIMQNDLGKRANDIHCCWARLFLRTVPCILRRMKKSNLFSFYSSSYHPTNKKLCS